MARFKPDQEVRVKADPARIGQVEWHAGRLVRVNFPDGSVEQFFDKDLELTSADREGEQAFVAGDLVPTQGATARFDTELLVGDSHKLVWSTNAGRGVNSNISRVELRRLDNDYVTTVAIGNVDPAHLALAMPYLEGRYFPTNETIGVINDGRE